ncbi:hypothetical protein AURDEDRAFT_43307, partial [Auricularia subglabra TFB-10046 SS5]
LNSVPNVVLDRQISTSNIYDVARVVGSTRIPCIVHIVSHSFNRKRPSMFLDPRPSTLDAYYDAAVQASVPSGDTSEKIQELVL